MSHVNKKKKKKREEIMLNDKLTNMSDEELVKESSKAILAALLLFSTFTLIAAINVLQLQDESGLELINSNLIDALIGTYEYVCATLITSCSNCCALHGTLYLQTGAVV